VVKNKLAPPFRQCEFDIYYGRACAEASELLDLGLDAGIVRKSGSWFAIEATASARAASRVREWLAPTPRCPSASRELRPQAGYGVS
jgi:recombination protein RecA